MYAGATLGRRFALLRSATTDLPGTERWIALDERRSIEVDVNVITASAPNTVRQAAVKAAQVRDARFARVIASGRETLAGERVTYVVTEPSTGLSLSAIVGRHVVPPQVAAAIVGEAARALGVAAALGVHHGHLRSAAIHVAEPGRVVISGLGTDGELAVQAGLGEAPSETADARSLARLHLALVTGLDPDAVTVGELPASLSARAANVARSVIAGTGPQNLAAVADAMGPADVGALRGLKASVRALPLAPGVDLSMERSLARRIDADAAGITIGAEALARAQQLAAAVAVEHATSGLAKTLRQGSLADQLLAGEEAATAYDTHAIPATNKEAAQYSARTRRMVARKSNEPLGLDTWEVIAAEQNRGTPPSVVQAALEWLHKRRPGSVVLGAAAEQARHRAQREAPIRSGPVLVSIFVAVTLVVTVVAWDTLMSPLNPNGGPDSEPVSPYPDFTFSPEPLPSPSGEQ